MGILDEIFGGSESKSKSVQKSTSSSSGSSSTKSDPVDLTPQPFKDLQAPLASKLGSLTSGGFGAIPSAASMGITGASAGDMQAATTETPEAMAIRQQGLVPEALGNPDGRESYTQDVIAGKYLPGQEGANPFYDEFYAASARPFTTEFERTVGRTLPSEFLKAGQTAGSDRGSSAFDRARAIATEGYANSLSDLAAKLGFETYNAERGRQQEAVQLSQADTDLMIKNYEAQLMPTFLKQFGVEQGMQEYQTRVAAALDILKTAASVTQPTIGQTTESQSKQSSQSKGSGTGTSTTDSSSGIIPGIGSILSVNR